MSTIQDRLKTLDIDPYFKTSLDEGLAKSWQRNNKIKFFLGKEILNILKDIYEPLGMWKQNPTSEKEDIGVIIDGSWSPLMQADTNYSCHSRIFNRCNKFLTNLYRKKQIESIEIEGEVFSYKNQIVFSPTDSEEETINKLKSILKIVRYKKNEIFLIGSPMYEELVDLFNMTMGFGDVAQHFYEKDINYFFPDMTNYIATKGRGDYRDRKEGVDIWKNHLNGKSTDQVKSVCTIIKKTGGYFIDVNISQSSICDYYVFVCNKSRIIIFKNNRDKILFQENGVFFPDELFYKEKFYDR